MDSRQYDPFVAGPHAAGVHTIQARDQARNRLFSIELWYPAQGENTNAPNAPPEERDTAALAGRHPLIVFSHSSGGNRRSSTFLAIHLVSHRYAVAAMDHSEIVAPELGRRDGETPDQLAARVEQVIASRVPDVRFLLEHLLDDRPAVPVQFDTAQIGLVGHSFGGWTVLATTEVEPRVRSIVALAAGGSSRPRPGILPVELAFDWGRDVPTLYLAAENDVPIPLNAVEELFRRTPGSKRMFILRRADHQHFVDDVEGEHEALRAMSLPGEAAWIPGAMLPMSELQSGEQAHLIVRGLTLAHLDATLRGNRAAEAFLDGDVEAEIARRGAEVMRRESGQTGR